MVKVLISAGEASGDLHAGAVTRAIKQLDPTAEVFGMGGDCLREAGGEVLFDIKDHSVMGFVEVLKRLPDIWKLRNAFIELMDRRKPDVLLTIDYPGFNMRLAKLAKERGIKVVSFIAPSAWAWRPSRAAGVVKVVDKIASIFPFEYDLYKSYGADIEFVGHPLVDTVRPSLPRKEAERLAGKRDGHPLILLMPGSRAMEIQRLLPDMLAAAKILKQKRPDIDFAMPRAVTIERDMLERPIKQAGLDVKLTEGHTYDIMSAADFAIATSGTVTLEAALCGLGQTAPNPVLSTMKYFRDEYMAHVVDKKCPAGVCKSMLQYIIFGDSCKSCGICKKNCPTNAISGDKKTGQDYVIDQEKCVKCGVCMEKCPFKAILKNA